MFMIAFMFWLGVFFVVGAINSVIGFGILGSMLTLGDIWDHPLGYIVASAILAALSCLIVI